MQRIDLCWGKGQAVPLSRAFQALIKSISLGRNSWCFWDLRCPDPTGIGDRGCSPLLRQPPSRGVPITGLFPLWKTYMEKGEKYPAGKSECDPKWKNPAWPYHWSSWVGTLVWVGRDVKITSSHPLPCPQARSTVPNCSKPCPTCPWTLPGMGKLGTNWARASPPTQKLVYS